MLQSAVFSLSLLPLPLVLTWGGCLWPGQHLEGASKKSLPSSVLEEGSNWICLPSWLSLCRVLLPWQPTRNPCQIPSSFLFCHLGSLLASAPWVWPVQRQRATSVSCCQSGEQDCFYDQRPPAHGCFPSPPGRPTQAPEPANGFCYHRHWMSLLPLTVSVSQGQELWCQLPPSYLPWLCSNMTDAFLKAAQLLRPFSSLAREPAAAGEVHKQVGADQDDSAFVCIETQGLIINGGSKSGLR